MVKMDPKIVQAYLLKTGVGQAADIDYVKNYIKAINDGTLKKDPVIFYNQMKKEVGPSMLGPTAKELSAMQKSVSKPAAKPTAPKPGAAPKAPTLASQLKAIAAQTNATPSEVEDEADIDVQQLFGAVTSELRKKYNPKNKGWGPDKTKYVKAKTAVANQLDKVNNKSEFLRSVLKLINPNFKASAAMNAKPGEFHTLTVPGTQKLTPSATKMMPNPANKEKADALAAKIAEYNAIIKKLEAEKAAMLSKVNKASSEKEKLSSGISPKLLKYFSFIEENCSEYLAAVKAAGGKILYRGQDDASQPIFVANPRADREPKDSDPEAQKLLDAALAAKGFKALRSNSLFTSSDIDQAGNYGTVYAIFPKNGFSFSWSRKHDDLVMNHVSDVDDNASPSEELYEEWRDDVLDGHACEIVYALHSSIGDAPSDFGLSNSASDKEITAKYKQLSKLPSFKMAAKLMDKFDAMDPEDETPANIISTVVGYFKSIDQFFTEIGFKNTQMIKGNQKVLALALKDQQKIGKQSDSKTGKISDEQATRIIKNMGYLNTDLPAALKAEHEVMIFGQYIAVDAEQFDDALFKYFIAPNKVAKKKK